ncbi:MAG: hypothetical protein WAK41_08075 [Roseiarcus sp.]
MAQLAADCKGTISAAASFGVARSASAGIATTSGGSRAPNRLSTSEAGM